MRCKKCSHVLAVPADVSDTDEIAAPRAPVMATKTKQAPAREAEDEEEDEPEEPVKVVKRPTSPESRQDVDEEEEEKEEEKARIKRPKRRRRKKRSSGLDLYRVALYQKSILLCILINLITIGLFFFLPKESQDIVGIALIPISIISATCLFLLTWHLFGVFPAIVFGILDLLPAAFPPVGLLIFIILLVVNGTATRRLKANKIRVGFLGANLDEARNAE